MEIIPHVQRIITASSPSRATQRCELPGDGKRCCATIAQSRFAIAMTLRSSKCHHFQLIDFSHRHPGLPRLRCHKSRRKKRRFFFQRSCAITISSLMIKTRIMEDERSSPQYLIRRDNFPPHNVMCDSCNLSVYQKYIFAARREILIHQRV